MTSRKRTSPGSIRAVAAETGLSVATVSRVMNNSPRVTEETRKRVLEASGRLGYLPNPAARALATQRSRVIGAIVPTLAHSIFATFLNEIEQTLSRLRYSVVVAISNNDPGEEYSRAQDLLGMGAEALILSGSNHLPALAMLLERHSVPHVYTSIFLEESAIPTIGYDNERIAGDAVRFLVGLGHRRIGVLHGPVSNNDRTRLRVAGAKRGAGEAAELKFFETSLDVEGGVKATRIALNGGRPTALLCLSDVLALGALFEAPRNGHRVPSDISVMGCDNLDWSAHAQPALTTVSIPTGEMGRRVAEALVAYLDGERGEIESLCLPAQVVERRSTAPPPAI